MAATVSALSRRVGDLAVPFVGRTQARAVRGALENFIIPLRSHPLRLGTGAVVRGAVVSKVRTDPGGLTPSDGWWLVLAAAR